MKHRLSLYNKWIAKSIFTVLGIALLTIITNCERDDICAESTPTTPNVNVAFFDITRQDSPKTVNQLTVKAEDSTDLIETITANSMSLPLFFTADGISSITRFEVTKDSALDDDDSDLTNSNTDIIELQYVPQFVYVSRACGYKSIFNDLIITVIQDENNWILSSEVINSTVEDNNEVHINLFH